MAFKIPGKSSGPVGSPEEMFDDYKNRTIKGLISHQADVLRDYYASAVNEKDVAIQLPTGSGKTLVGLLLAEWRRKKFGERVLYLCPTKQLVNQVVEQGLKKYGIKSTAFVGPAKDYEPSSRKLYQNSETVAVAPYAALFNANPFFDDPNVVILDDAHVAENYLSDFWSIEIEKNSEEIPGLFDAIVGLMKPYISPVEFNRLLNPDRNYDPSWIDKLPSPSMWEIQEQLVELISASVSESRKRYSWQNIKNHITACNLYYSNDLILIRPIILPNLTHKPLANAKQRIYMSATLGTGGDLERMLGIGKISRISCPKKWETTAIGRRLFFFPDYSLKEEEKDELISEMVKIAGRALVLCPSFSMASEIEKALEVALPDEFTFYDARGIEESKSAFVKQSKAVAVIANRYDGIDFEHDECRLLVIHGFPKAFNMQEGFFVTRLAARELMLDRRVTRITQALGRCTRGENDYAAVVISGDEFSEILINKERRKHLHPEFQSEVEFGLEQAKEASKAVYIENLELFLNHDKEWNEAEKYIIQKKNEFQPIKSVATDQLESAVKHEIDYLYSLWRSDYVQAFDSAREVIGLLTDSGLQGYRTLWNYLAGSAIFYDDLSKGNSRSAKSAEYFRAAAKSNLSINWFSRLGEKVDVEITEDDQNNAELSEIVERLERSLERLGTQQNYKFSKEVEEVTRGVNSSDAKVFELAQVRLGKLIGYEAGKKEESASPDPWWIVSENLYLVFEDHSGALGKTPFDATKARQAYSHPNWVKQNLKPKEDAEIIPVIISPCMKFEDSALPHLANTKFWPVGEYRSWATNVLSEIRELRKTFSGPGNLAWRSVAMSKYKALNLDPKGMRGFLSGLTHEKVLLKKSK